MSRSAAAPPAFSVVVPTHDRRELLPRAVASVLAQEGTDFQLVVVDDGSRDGTAEWLAAQHEPALAWLRLAHRGVSAARNAGAARARGELLVFLDSDDELAPGALARFAAALGPGVGLACGAVLRRPVDAGDEAAEVTAPERWGEPFATRVSTLAGSFAVRCEVFVAAGGYSEELAFGENSELLLRLLAACRERGLAVASFDEPTVVYHQSDRESDRRRIEEQLHASEFLLRHHRELYRRHPHLLAQVHANAGVRAARLGRFADARRHFAAALRRRPADPRAAARWLLALVPPLARRAWPPAAPPDEESTARSGELHRPSATAPGAPGTRP